jgi:hypothetical protein
VSQLADSTYFLGFLWTLWALIDAFAIRKRDSSAAFEVFGYALATTATGMALRLFLLHFKYGSGDQANQAQRSVEENLQKFSVMMQGTYVSLERFTAQLGLLSSQLQVLSKQVNASTTDMSSTQQQMVGEVRTVISKTVEDIRSELKAPVQEYGRSIRAFTANVNKQSEVFATSAQVASNAMVEAATNSSKSVEAVVQTGAARISAEMTNLVATAGSSIQGVVSNFRDLGSISFPTAKLLEFSTSVDGLQKSCDQLAKTLGPLGGIQSALEGTARKLDSSSALISGELEKVASRVARVEVPERVVVDVSALTKALEGLKRSVEGLLITSSDDRWQSAPRNAADAMGKLTIALEQLRRTVQATERPVKSDGSRWTFFWK